MGKAASALERARSLHESISAEAAEAERVGRLTDKTARAMLDANLCSQLLPVSAGGLGASREEFFATVEEVAHADGSAGWCLSACSMANALIHLALPEDGRRAVLGAGPVALWASLIPCARSQPAEGGFRLSGDFAWGSGSSFSDWVIVAELLPERDGEQWSRAYVVPKRDVAIDPDSWNPMGLKATASVNYRIEDAFVPDSRCFEYPFIQGERPGWVSTYGAALLNQLGLTAFASGVAARAMAELVAGAPQTSRSGAPGSQAEDELTQHGIGIHSGRLIAARSHFLGMVGKQDESLAGSGTVGAELTLASTHATQTLIHAARDATVFAWDSLSSSIVLDNDPVQRCLRDIFTGLKHVTFTPAVLSRAGKAQLGIDSSAPRFR
jgi:alkylation response protein AidB-like acyl-CoA dehydrogenase